MAQVSLENVSKWFGSVPAVRDVNLKIEDGEFAVLVGPSGCGKTTTLRMIAGLEEMSSGTIRFDGQVVNELPPKARDIAMVFQSYALYPQMTVAQNMAFSLKMKRRPRTEAMAAVRHAAELLNISELLERKPRELSGGQRQRVAMGRAIVRRPRVFLFDEPLSNLDAALRSQMRVEIKRIHQRLETTVIHVTHDQIEAMTLADRIVLMNDGEIVQMGSPMAVYEKPLTKFVAGFIGSPRMNFLRARLVEDAAANGLAAELSQGLRLAIPGDRTAAYRRYLGRSVEIGLRPEHMTEEPLAHPNAASFEASVDVIEPTGSVMLVFCSIDGQVFTAHGDSHVAKRPGQPIRVHADMSNMHLVDLENDRIVPV